MIPLFNFSKYLFIERLKLLLAVTVLEDINNIEVSYITPYSSIPFLKTSSKKVNSYIL